MASRSTATVFWNPRVASQPQGGNTLQSRPVHAKPPGGCGAQGTGRTAKRKWLIIAGVVLAIAAAVTGSIWFGFAAVLPLLYLLPCLAMTAMCLKNMKGSSSTDAGST